MHAPDGPGACWQLTLRRTRPAVPLQAGHAEQGDHDTVGRPAVPPTPDQQPTGSAPAQRTARPAVVHEVWCVAHLVVALNVHGWHRSRERLRQAPVAVPARLEAIRICRAQPAQALGLWAAGTGRRAGPLLRAASHQAVPAATEARPRPGCIKTGQAALHARPGVSEVQQWHTRGGAQLMSPTSRTDWGADASMWRIVAAESAVWPTSPIRPSLRIRRARLRAGRSPPGCCKLAENRCFSRRTKALEAGAGQDTQLPRQGGRERPHEAGAPVRQGLHSGDGLRGKVQLLTPGQLRVPHPTQQQPPVACLPSV